MNSSFMTPFRLDSILNSVSSQMAKARPSNSKTGKNGPNDGNDGPTASPTEGVGKSQNHKDPGPPKSGPHPPSPPESPKQHRASLSGLQTRLPDRNLHVGGSSNRATGAPTPSTAAPSIHNDPTALAVDDLLGTMKNTLKALASTFGILGDQTIRVASLGPAVDALSQIERVQHELNEKTQQQDREMQDVKARQLETVKEHIREVLRPRVNKIVETCVQKEIEARVHHELTEQIPASLREELLQYRVRVMEARRNLRNSEARRHNALIHSSGLDEPLKPLLRPLHLPVSQDARIDPDGTPEASGGNDKGEKDKETKNKAKDEAKDRVKDQPEDKGKGKGKNKSKDDTGILTPPSTAGSVVSGTTSRTARPDVATSRLSLNTAVSHPTGTSATATAFEGPPGSALDAGGVGLGGRDIATPTPSPHFPHTVAALVSMPADQARALAREYGLVGDDDERDDEDGNPTPARGAGPSVRGRRQGGNARGGRGGAQGGRAERPASMATACSDASSWVNAGLAGTREDDLNKFMRYIGVDFQVLPSSPIAIGGGAGGAMLSSPVVGRRDATFR